MSEHDQQPTEDTTQENTTPSWATDLLKIQVPQVLPEGVLRQIELMDRVIPVPHFELPLLDWTRIADQIHQQLQPILAHYRQAMETAHQAFHGPGGLQDQMLQLKHSIDLATQINITSFLPDEETLEKLRIEMGQYHQVLDTASTRGWLVEMVLGFLPWDVARTFMDLYLDEQFDEADTQVLEYFQHRADHLLDVVKTAMFESLPADDAAYRFSRFEPTVLALRDEDEKGYRYSAVAMYAEAEGYFADLAVARGLMNPGDWKNLLYRNTTTSNTSRSNIIQGLLQTIPTPPIVHCPPNDSATCKGSERNAGEHRTLWYPNAPI
ncbi:hypothetical protein [Deinococcus roseus]|uniref:M3 family oligoendopeptidase n=1 Tax=Deinococcus roseus TaxID=392414 RepID=A0ABQ2DLZ1_9DEIO|nr:hypothetical protein [Deinococcus roseus]GGJ59345.1 hypothetical protein GCM10008938_51860 [Deinococcus roseus]